MKTTYVLEQQQMLAAKTTQPADSMKVLDADNKQIWSITQSEGKKPTELTFCEGLKQVSTHEDMHSLNKAFL